MCFLSGPFDVIVRSLLEGDALCWIRPKAGRSTRANLVLEEIREPGLSGQWILKLEREKYDHEPCGIVTRERPLAMPSNNCKLQTRPLVREGTPYEHCNFIQIQIKNKLRGL
jgi:hypothetical protein